MLLNFISYFSSDYFVDSIAYVSSQLIILKSAVYNETSLKPKIPLDVLIKEDPFNYPLIFINFKCNNPYSSNLNWKLWESSFVRLIIEVILFEPLRMKGYGWKDFIKGRDISKASWRVFWFIPSLSQIKVCKKQKRRTSK